MRVRPLTCRFRSGRSALATVLLIALPAFVLGLEHATQAARVAGGQDRPILAGFHDEKRAEALVQGGAVANQPLNRTNVEGTVTTIDVIASRFKFEPATVSVAKGNRVRLRLRSADRTHAFAIKELRVKAVIPKMGEATVEFVADRGGRFEFTCAEYCGTGHRAMKGTLVVLASGI
jgi:cytochrome c oxidase subunit 2